MTSFQRFMDDCGITEEMNDFVRQYDDGTDFKSMDGVSVDSSPIHGFGIFANRFYLPGYGVGWANLNGSRTLLGVYTNHADNANCTVMPTIHGIMLVTLQSIEAGEEMTIDYRDAINAANAYRDELHAAD